MRKFKYATVIYLDKNGRVDESLNPQGLGGIHLYVSDAENEADHVEAVAINLPGIHDSEVIEAYDRNPKLYGITCFGVSFGWENGSNPFKDVDEWVKGMGYIRA